MEIEKMKLAPPPAAMRFQAGSLEVTRNEENGKSVKVHMKARSKLSCEHFWWGKFVHDFSTMSMPPRIAIDDSHGLEVGYGRPYLTEYGIEIDATLIPNAENPAHPANRIIYNLTNGIPQQASIDFCGPFDIEYLDEHQLAEVNGNVIQGPCVIFRNWSLRACAICKEGVDASSETTMLSGNAPPPPRRVSPAAFVLEVSRDDTPIDKEDKEEKQETPDGADQPETPPDDKPDGADSPEGGEPEGNDASVPDEKPEDDGNEDGDKEKEELRKQLEDLRKENEELRARLSAFPNPGAEPVILSESRTSREELLKEYAQLSPSEKTLFWRKHKNELMKQ